MWSAQQTLPHADVPAVWPSENFGFAPHFQCTHSLTWTQTYTLSQMMF